MDSFGPIGFGVHAPPGVGNPALPPSVAQFLPSYPGPQAAWETTDDIMASPASVGSTLFDTLDSPFFGERDDIKLAFDDGADRGRGQRADARCTPRCRLPNR